MTSHLIASIDYPISMYFPKNALSSGVISNARSGGAVLLG